MDKLDSRIMPDGGQFLNKLNSDINLLILIFNYPFSMNLIALVVSILILKHRNIILQFLIFLLKFNLVFINQLDLFQVEYRLL
jgi:hypothetical protein